MIWYVDSCQNVDVSWVLLFELFNLKCPDLMSTYEYDDTHAVKEKGRETFSTWMQAHFLKIKQ